MKNKLLLLICLVLSNIIMSQEYFYYHNGSRISLELNTKYIYVSAKINKELPSIGNMRYHNVDTINESYLNCIGFASPNTQIRHNASAFLGNNLSRREYIEIFSHLAANKDIIVSPSYNLDGERLELSEYFYVCLHQLSDTTLLKNKAIETNVRIVAQDLFMANWFTLAVIEGSSLNSLEAANLFYESGEFRSAEPDFRIENPQLSSDTYYSQQWGLENVGQHEGVEGVDIKAESAWIYSTGEDIKVAVIDHGIQLDHPDLQNNVYHLSFDTETNASPSGIYGYHGTACAGIVGAIKDNDIGISGVAPDCKLMSVSNKLVMSNLYTKNIASGINWAWLNGADIISNSYYAPISDYIDDAIDNAINNGRNGLGCLLFYSSGNNNQSSIIYPASLPGTISVGAMSPCGERKNPISCDGENYWGSNFGEGLDVVAPGVLVPTTTIDGEYKLNFNGTSAACPHAAGVAALMLSVNPNLTRLQITDIIKRTAQKVGGYNYQIQNNDPQMTWCPETGYGLVDAHMAVVESMLYGTNPTLNGSRDMYMCDDYTFTCDIVNQGAFSYEWSHSDNLVVLSADSNMVKVKPINLGDAWIEVNVYSESRLIRTLEINDITINESYIDNLIPLSLSSLHITQNMTLSNNNHYLLFDAIVEEDVTLTITGSVYCSDLASIKVKPGGKLIVDGGKLTSDCETSKWQGIEVWGNDSVPQYPYDGVYSQGFLELKNGATIENAVCAVELWNPLDNHSEGGIVHATDAIFRNNAKAIHALNYTNYDPEMIFEIDYNSSFNNCSFVVDSNYMGEELFQRHIDLSNVSGFNLHGCSFSVDKSVPQVSPRPYGIVANNTGLNLSYYIPEDELLLPGGNFTRNSFEGFETGIYVTNSSQYSRTVSVEYSDFSNNAKGLLVQNTSYATINNNNFIIGYDSDCSFGLYLDRVSYFDVEENTFIGNANYGSDNYGVMVRSSASYNDISRNTFRNLQCGNVSLGKNYVTGSRVGLTYTCNTNIGNVNDFCIFKEDGIGGISSCQGSLVDPAGNTFSGSNYHICNDGDNTISYYYQSNNNLQRPVASKLYNVRAVGSSNISSCGIGNIPVIDIMSIDDVVTLENAYNTTLAAYNALLQTNSQSVETAEDIEAQLSQLKTEYLNTVGEIVKFYLQQEEKDYEELREWLVKSEDIFADRMVVASFIQEGNYDDAMTYATMLPKIHNLKGEELQDHNDYMKLIDLYIDLHEADRTANQLTDAELTMVKNISDNGIGTSQMMAESILLAIGEPSLRVPQCLTMPPALIILPQTRGAEQEIEFASVGTKWYYDYNEDMTGWDNGYVLIESVIDTLIDDMSCRKLVKTIYEYNQDSNEEQQRVIGYEYVSQIDDSVIIYRDGEFKKLYDFGAEVGDTLIIPGHDYDPALTNGQGVVVDKGTIEFDGQTLRYIDLKHPKDTPWQFPIFVSYGEDYYTVRICEKIGNISGYLLPEPYNTGVEVLWEGGGALRCYSDNVMSVSFQDKACDYIVSVDEINSQGSINIFPNPANDNITIELAADCHTIEIYDSFGRMMMSQQVTESLSHQVVDIDISKYPSGLYLVVVKDDNNRYYKRIVKN